MKNPYIIFSFFAIAAALFFSCKKDHECTPGQRIDFNEGELDTSFITDEYIKSLIFQPGTFWVYQNDSTGVKDSLIVEDYFHTYYYWGYFGGAQFGAKYIEFVKITIKNPALSTHYYMYASENRITQSNYDRIPDFQNYSVPGQSVLGTGNPKTDSMLVNNYWHKDIREKKIIAVEQTEMFYSEDTDLYFAKSVGIIKKITANESWSLINWNIVK